MLQVFAVYGGVSPLISVWIPDMLYGVLCIVLVAYVRKWPRHAEPRGKLCNPEKCHENPGVEK